MPSHAPTIDRQNAPGPQHVLHPPDEAAELPLDLAGPQHLARHGRQVPKLRGDGRLARLVAPGELLLCRVGFFRRKKE